MQDWIITTLGDLKRREIISLQTGPFGSQLHSHEYESIGIPVVPTEAIGRRKLKTDRLPLVAPSTADRLARHKLREGDILFARRGLQATGLSAIVERDLTGVLCGTGLYFFAFSSP